MRRAIAPQHRSAFYKQGFVTFEGGLSEGDLATLRSIIPSPRLPPLLQLIKKKQLAEIVYELIDREPLRIAEVFFGKKVELQEGDCALLIDLATGDMTYTNLPSGELDIEAGLMVIFTPRYLDVEKHPVVYRRG